MPKFTDTPYDRLRSAAEWAMTSENIRISIRKEDLFWIMEEKAKLDMIFGLDSDLGDELAAEPADLSKEEPPL